MATREQLEDALRNADSAGDKSAATALADALSNGQFEGYVAGNDKTDDAPKNAAAEYDAMPGWKKPLVAMDDIVRAMANGATFGYADKLSAKMSPGDYTENLKGERQASADAEDRAGWADTAAKAVGGIAGMTAAGVPSAIGAIPRAWSLPARAAASVPLGAVEGAAYGALDATGHDTNVADGAITGAAVGGVAAPVLQGVNSLAANVMNRISGANRTPSVAELRDTKNAQYRAVEDAQAVYPPNRIVQTVNDLNTDLRGSPHNGIRTTRHPMAADMMDQLNDTASTTRGESLYDLDIMRQNVNNDVIAQGGSEAKYGGDIRRGLDGLIGDTTGVTAARGTPQEAVDSLLSARETNRRMGNLDDLQTEGGRAERRTQRTTGSSEGNPLRQRVSAILDSPSRGEYYNPEEIGLMQQVVAGSPGGNFARRASDALGGVKASLLGAGTGGYLGSMVGQPGTGGIIGGLVPKAASGVLDNIAERSTQGMFEDLQHLVATGNRLSRGATASPISRQREADIQRLMLNLGIEERRNDKPRRKAKD